VTHRRSFLRHLGGLVGAPAFGTLWKVREAFARELQDVALQQPDPASFAALRDRYMLSPGVTYFNHGSIGTIPRSVHDAQVAYLRVCESNPWLYMWGGEWEEPRERVREKAALILGCDPVEVSFTHNTTEGFNTLARGLSLGPGDEVLFGSLNHAGASLCWHHNAPVKGFTVRQFDFPLLDIPGITVPEILDVYDANISDRTRVLVLPHIDNVVGLLHPVKEITQLARSRGVDIIAVDGAQSVGMLEVNMHDLDVDVYCTSPHKWLQSPKGLGLMYVKRDLLDGISPMWVTWGQQRWNGTARVFEDYGTRNLAEVITLGDAIDFQLSLGAEAKARRYRELWGAFRAAATQTDRVIWRSPESWSMGSSLYALEIRGKPSTDVFESMYSDHGFVFRAFRTPQLNTVRISPNVFNTEEEIERFFALVETL